ncbi:MAG TPA: class I SAM-dependent methyltransferase [Actinomycetes bacterium]|nr:class I SAM-dependent methyltransferase [Actinomycetes bacterium]
MIELEPVDPEFYDREYYTSGTKSNYAPYGPGSWADWIVDMAMNHVKPRPSSVLDVGCAYGFLVERFWNRLGVPAWGFDISRYAIEKQGFLGRTWVGDCADPAAWKTVDLTLACELGEHLTPAQAQQMLRNAFTFSNRALMLIAVDLGDYDSHAETDGSHIHVVPMAWWEQAAREAGWSVADASAFNEDWRSSQMGWSGRWLYLTKEA